MRKADLSLETAKEMYKSGGVAKQFVLDNYTEQELTTREVKCWEDLEVISGARVEAYGQIYEFQDWTIKHDTGFPNMGKNIFAYYEQAEAAIAMAMLSQLMKDVNGDWKPDWEDKGVKYVLFFKGNQITKGTSLITASFLAFPTAITRDKFLENHRELIEKAKPLL